MIPPLWSVGPPIFTTFQVSQCARGLVFDYARRRAVPLLPPKRRTPFVQVRAITVLQYTTRMLQAIVSHSQQYGRLGQGVNPLALKRGTQFHYIMPTILPPPSYRLKQAAYLVRNLIVQFAPFPRTGVGSLTGSRCLSTWGSVS